MTGDAPQDVDERYAQLRTGARRRWLWSLLGIGLFSGLVGPLASHLHLFGSQHQRHHSGAGVGAVLAAVVVLVFAAVYLIWMVRQVRQDKGIFRAPTSYGLPRRQRRAIGRAVRRVRPSDDPLLRRVESETATRLVRQGRRSIVFLLLFALGGVARRGLLGELGGRTGFLQRSRGAVRGGRSGAARPDAACAALSRGRRAEGWRAAWR